MLLGHYICVLAILMEIVNVVNSRPGYILYPSKFNKKITTQKNYEKNKNETKIRSWRNIRSISADAFQGSYPDIIFPDSSESLAEPLPRLDDTPICADSDTFCEDYENYPHGHVKIALRQHFSEAKLFFGVDEVPKELEQRLDAPQEDNYLCATARRVVFPKVAKNRDNQWKYIVNQKGIESFVQGVQIETCRNQDGPCNIIGELPNGYTTSCKQKYVYRKLLSLNEEGVPVPDTFRLPSACCCSYNRVSFLARSGDQVTQIQQQH